MSAHTLAQSAAIGAVIFGLLGWYVGRRKGRPGLGAVLGLVFGVFGVVIIALVPARARYSPWSAGPAPMAPPPVPPPSVPAQWAPDPSGRHEYRWWDGKGWTDHVSDGGLQSLDVSGPA